MNLVEIVEGSASIGTEFEGSCLNLSALENDQTDEECLCKEVEESLKAFCLMNEGFEDIFVYLLFT